MQINDVGVCGCMRFAVPKTYILFLKNACTHIYYAFWYYRLDTLAYIAQSAFFLEKTIRNLFLEISKTLGQNCDRPLDLATGTGELKVKFCFVFNDKLQWSVILKPIKDHSRPLCLPFHQKALEEKRGCRVNHRGRQAICHGYRPQKRKPRIYASLWTKSSNNNNYNMK